MFDKLKNIFAKDSTVHAQSVRDYVDKTLAQIESDLKQETASISEELDSILEKLDETLDKLGKMELQNKKVPQRVLQIMQGNRETYIRNTRKFMNRIDTNIDPLGFTKMVSDELENLGASNARGNQVLSEFFRNEVVAVSIGLRSIVKLGKKLDKTVENLRLKEIHDIKKQIDDMDELAAKQVLVNKQKEKLGKNIIETEDKKAQLLSQIQEIKKSDEYKVHIEHKKQKEKLLVDIKNSEKVIWEMFNRIQPALKKYARMSLHEKIIKNYLDDPLLALDSDKNLDIMNILKDMKNTLESGKLDLKQKKMENAQSGLKNLIASLSDKTDARIDLLERKKLLNEEIRQTYQRDLEEAVYRMNHLDGRISKLKDEKNNFSKPKTQHNPDLVAFISKKMDIELIIDEEISD